MNRTDETILFECLKGAPDWRTLAAKTGMMADEVIDRSVEIGAFFLIGAGTNAAKKAAASVINGGTVAEVAAALGTNDHGAYVFAGMLALRNRE